MAVSNEPPEVEVEVSLRRLLVPSVPTRFLTALSFSQSPRIAWSGVLLPLQAQSLPVQGKPSLPNAERVDIVPFLIGVLVVVVLNSFLQTLSLVEDALRYQSRKDAGQQSPQLTTPSQEGS